MMSEPVGDYSVASPLIAWHQMYGSNTDLLILLDLAAEIRTLPGRSGGLEAFTIVWLVFEAFGCRYSEVLWSLG